MITASSIKINASNKHIWDIISAPNSLELFHPFVKFNPRIVWNDNQKIDSVEYYNGMSYNRSFIEWIDGTGFDLKINYSVVKWRISSGVTIESITEKNNTWSVDQIMLEQYLSHVLRGLKFYAETGILVKQDQFGKHVLFSESKHLTSYNKDSTI